MRFFLDRKPWMDFLGTMDVSFGHRIHGALLSILAGTPAAIVPFESRTEELARFHGLPIISPETAERPEAAKEALRAMDCGSLRRRQAQNFPNWLAFLRENGLRTVFDRLGATPPSPSDFPLERQLPNRFPDSELRAWAFNPPGARARMRLVFVRERMTRKTRNLKGRIAGKARSLFR